MSPSSSEYDAVLDRWMPAITRNSKPDRPNRGDLMRFIDLFAGLGGFHLALEDLGHECVFASEINETLRGLYERNFGMKCAGDIRRVDAKAIPEHDILCAGFPCQPFSKAGRQSGLDDPELGGLYLQILRVVQYHKPKYLILENVPNLEQHGNGKSWQKIKGRLEAEGYNVDIEKISPDQFGIPQIRNRIYIVGSLTPLDVSKRLRRGRRHKLVSLRSFLKVYPVDARPIPTYVKVRLDAWQEFLNVVPKDERFPHPLWSMEFGATYPYEQTTPSAMTTEELRKYRGSFGRRLSEGETREQVFSMIPSHARRPQDQFPNWKIRFIKRNRDFYATHADILEGWINKIQTFSSSFQKFEWNCIEPNPSNEDRRLSQYIVQVRPSGVRVKRPTTAPSLVAMNATQVPIVMWEERFMTPTEEKLLQSMDRLRYLPESNNMAYKALGNAVNVRVAKRVAMALVGKASDEDVVHQVAEAKRRLAVTQSILSPSR